MARVPVLPSLTWKDFRGIDSKTADELADPSNSKNLRNVDGYDSWRALGKVPGSSVQSPYLGSAVKSLDYYEHFDLAKTLRQRKIAIAGGKLYEIESASSARFLGGDFTNEFLRAVVYFDRFHASSPKNEPFKYDGDALSRWGVVAPGSEQFTQLAIDDHTIWTVNDSGTNQKADDPDVAMLTSGSVKIDKLTTGAGDTSIYIEASSLNLNLAAAGAGLAVIWLFLPEGSLRKAATSDPVEVWLGDDATDYDQHTYAIGELFEGWNPLVLDLANPDGTGGAGLTTLADVDYVRLVLNFRDGRDTLEGIRWNNLYIGDEGSPVASVKTGASGGVTDTVSYRVVYLTKFGQLSNAGPPSNSLTMPAGGGVVKLTNIPISPDPQVVARWLYRDINGDALWTFVTAIEDNTTTEYEDSIPHASKTSEGPPLAADDQDDNTPPGRFAQVIRWRGHIFGISAANPFLLEISDFDEPESFPVLNQRTFDFDLVTLKANRRGLILCGSDKTVLVTGDEWPFSFDEIHPETGAAGARAMDTAHVTTMVLHDDGPYIHDGVNPWYLGTLIKDIFDDLDPAAFADAFVIHDRRRFRALYFLQSTAGGSYDTILQWSYGMTAGEVSVAGYGVDPTDLRIGMWTRLSLPEAVNPQCAAMIETVKDKPELWVGGSDGWIYRLQDPDALNWALGSSGSEAVNCEIDLDWQPLGQHDQRPEVYGFARFLLVQAAASVKSTWSAVVQAGSSPKKVDESVTVSFEIGPGNTTPIVPIPPITDAEGNEHHVHGTWFNVVLSNATLGETGIIEKVQLFYVPRRFRGARAA